MGGGSKYFSLAFLCIWHFAGGIRLIQNEDCWTSGACTESPLIDETATEDPEGCEKYCKDNPDCIWFTFYDQTGICTLLTGCKLLTADFPGAISGQSKCGGMPDCYLTGRCTGTLTGVFKAETPEACLEICQANGERRSEEPTM